MKNAYRCSILAAAALVPTILLSAAAAANDRVKLLAGGQSAGKVTEITPSEIVVTIGSNKKKFAVNEIDVIQFEAEPTDLTQARFAERAGRYEDALNLLSKIDLDKVDRADISKDIDYYKAISAARLALAGSGSKLDAGKKLLAFEKANRTSFHYYEACEVLGDILAALGKYAEAESFYDKLAEAPWPAYKLRAGVLAGRALVHQKEFDRAVTRFDQVLAADGSDKDAERQKLAASLGKAAALAGSGKNEEAIKATEAIIAKADPDNQELYARAYTILGNCYTALGKKKEALLAFLHVDLLYSRFPEQHAEALANLATLWADVDKADRAAQAQNLLKEKYPGSVWANK